MMEAEEAQRLLELGDLPTEMLLHAFTFLDIHSLSSVCQVCQAWHSLASAPFLWERAYNKRFVVLGDSEGIFDYHPLTGFWQRILDHRGFERRGLGAISFDGSIWVAGGDVWGLETPSVCTFERIAPSNFSVTKMPPMLHRRAHFGLCQLNRRVYAFGGTDGDRHLDSIEAYDLDNNKWELIGSSMPFSLAHFSTAVVNECIYAIAGRSPYHQPSGANVLKFDTVSHEWTLLAPMNGRGGCSGSSVYLDGFIYTTIGEIFERYNIKENRWEVLPNRRNPQGIDKLFTLEGELYAFSHLGVEKFSGTTWTSFPAPYFEGCPWGEYQLVQLSKKMQRG